ncbi:MAG: hypothetical protein ACI9SC_000473 [Gammaproteobacteria bacterium]|jgi:hypothetical protein
MKSRKLYVTPSFAAIIAVGCLLGPIQASASISLSLSGQGAPSTYGFGAKRLYLGGDFSSNLNHPYTNWTWSDLEMTIQSDGDATISGTMTRDYNSEVWGVNIQLDDIEFRKTSGSYKDGQNWSGSVDQ